jgi:hypothetical protein
MDELDSIRVLVTRGAGFIGPHLCERLLKDGCEVLCVNNFYMGRRKNIAHLLEQSAFEVSRHDIAFPLYVETDQIYNMACPASPVHYQSDPVQTAKLSVHGAINMLGLAKRVEAYPASVHIRSLRRPMGASAGRKLLVKTIAYFAEILSARAYQVLREYSTTLQHRRLAPLGSGVRAAVASRRAA